MEEVTSVGFAGIMKYTRVHTKFVASLDTLTRLADGFGRESRPTQIEIHPTEPS
jgi:hypothetical protein